MPLINKKAHKPLVGFGLQGANIYRLFISAIVYIFSLLLTLAATSNYILAILLTIGWLYYYFIRLKKVNKKFGVDGYQQDQAKNKLPKVIHNQRLNTIIKQ